MSRASDVVVCCVLCAQEIRDQVLDDLISAQIRELAAHNTSLEDMAEKMQQQSTDEDEEEESEEGMFPPSASQQGLNRSEGSGLGAKHVLRELRGKGVSGAMRRELLASTLTPKCASASSAMRQFGARVRGEAVVVVLCLDGGSCAAVEHVVWVSVSCFGAILASILIPVTVWVAQAHHECLWMI